MKEKNNFLLSGLLVLVSLVWAGSFIVVKQTTTTMNPVDLGFLRFLTATPIMIILLLLRRKKTKIPRKELPSLIILGLTGVTFLYVFQFLGISYTTASASSVLINTNVIFIAILSIALFHEQFTKKKTSGIVLSFLGVIIIIFSNIQNEHVAWDSLFVLGCFLILLSALCWAVYSIVGKRLLATYDSITVTTYAFILGTLLYIPFIIQSIPSTIQTITFDGWGAVLYLAVFCSVFGYLGWYYALQRTDASKAAVFLNLIPLFTILLSLIYGEIPTPIFLGGAILIILGVYLTQKS